MRAWARGRERKRRGAEDFVTQAPSDASPAGKGWSPETPLLSDGGSWGLEHQRISIKEVSVRRLRVLGRTVGPGALSQRVAESKRRGVARALCIGGVFLKVDIRKEMARGWLLTLHLVWTKSLARNTPQLSLSLSLLFTRVMNTRAGPTESPARPGPAWKLIVRLKWGLIKRAVCPERRAAAWRAQGLWRCCVPQWKAWCWAFSYWRRKCLLL